MGSRWLYARGAGPLIPPALPGTTRKEGMKTRERERKKTCRLTPPNSRVPGRTRGARAKVRTGR